MATNYERIIVRKKNELLYAEKRLESAIDEYNQFVFCPDFVGSEPALKLCVTNWEQHIADIKTVIAENEIKVQQQSLDWGFE